MFGLDLAACWRTIVITAVMEPVGSERACRLIAGMGKCRKRPRRSSAYPYSAIPVSSHIHIVRPKVRSDGTAPMFLGTILTT